MDYSVNKTLQNLFLSLLITPRAQPSTFDHLVPYVHPVLPAMFI